MSLLNLQHFQPVMLFSLARANAQLGPCDEQTLMNWLSPAAFGLDVDERATQRAIRGLLGAATTLGVLSISRTGTLETSIECETLARFKRDLRGLALDRRRNRGLLTKGELAPTQGDGAEELTWALTWMMSVPATRGPFGFKDAERIYAKEQRLTPPPFQNDTRFPTFVAWAQFLGFGWTTSLGPTGALRYVPDPTIAVSESLDKVFGDEDGCYADEFISRVAKELPVLDDGAYRAVLDGRLDSQGAKERQELSEPLSLALLRLQDRGVLNLEPLPDSAARVARLNKLTQAFQRVSRPKMSGSARSTRRRAKSGKATR